MTSQPVGYRRWSGFAVIGPLLRGTAWLGVGPGVARIDVVGLLSWMSGVRYIERYSGRVVVVRFLLRPPWGSTAVFLDGRSRFHLGPFAGPRVMEALTSPGFDVERRQAMFMTPADDVGGVVAERIRR